ncbi:two-component sensor histidine kinase [Carbonactinospora thermoautotrophica]|uniref:sensor histidine kinase n=1 Tax=Carbonactinospora thermoautotrophica TaxID=1469144 RepID=UPI00226E094C|nr:ATP-binding protein [Carbonactinospora thermoautotrophica]MCX9193219.1 two-component sensor histidine kinase [Carbonactinospora thermoautotrophica]
MDVSVASGLAGLVGFVTGALAVLAFRWSEREREAAVPSPPEDTLAALPPGAAAVLSVLRSSAVVLDDSDRVVKASAAAHSFGIVRGDRLVAEELLRIARQVRRDGEIRQEELELPRGPLGKEKLAVHARVAPLGSRFVLVLVEDHTEAKRVEAIRRDFVANVSHELKTPIGALSLLAEAVLGASDDPEAVRRFAGRMLDEAARLSSLVQEIIDLSRLQGDDPLRHASPVSIDDVVAEAVDRSRALAQAKSIELVSGGEEGLRVLGDENQLAMALGNLVENAVTYSPEHTRVAIGVRRVGDLVEISVTDQGIGIPETELQRIFERFYRVDKARSRSTGGTGLGLSIVKHVAANHGGEVSVWSVEGQGSTFTLRLPLVATSTAPAESTKTSAREATP